MSEKSSVNRVPIICEILKPFLLEAFSFLPPGPLSPMPSPMPLAQILEPDSFPIVDDDKNKVLVGSIFSDLWKQLGDESVPGKNEIRLPEKWKLAVVQQQASDCVTMLSYDAIPRYFFNRVAIQKDNEGNDALFLEVQEVKETWEEITDKKRYEELEKLPNALQVRLADSYEMPKKAK